jgi:hypothetical protein
MRSLVAIICTVVALGAVAGAWLQARPEPTADDASALAASALRAAGVPAAPAKDGPVEDGAVVAGVYENPVAGERFDVWQVTVQIATGATIELDVDRASGGFVQLDDVVDGRYALTDVEAQAIHDFDGRFPSLDDRLRRNFAAAGAGLLVTAVAVCLTMFAPRRAAPRPADLPPSPA